MIALCTGRPKVTVGDNHIVIAFPSGDGFAQAAVTLNQLVQLRGAIMNAIDDAFGREAIPCAQVIPLGRQGRG